MDMSTLPSFTREWWPYVAAVTTAGVTLILVIRNHRQKAKPSWPRDTVILRQFTRGPWAPSVSPFPVKLETYLKMAGIPYVSDNKAAMSKKSKIPWISYNDEDVADSQLCIEYLNKKFQIDLNKHLTDEQKAIAIAFQRVVEDNLYWSVVMQRWVYDQTFVRRLLSSVVPGLMVRWLLWTVSRSVGKQAWQQGIGRHSKEEVTHMADVNLKALSDYIGTKAFLTGDQPCEQDCAIFGSLSQLMWHLPDTKYKTMVHETYPNLGDYCIRMKEKFWPDWDECITHGYTREATK